MNACELAKSFVQSFCRGDIAGIEAVLSEDFQLDGPLFQFNSKAGYVSSLVGNLDPDSTSNILSILGNENEAAVFFRYKGNTIGQLFKCRDGKIHETILVFDSKKVA